MFDNILIANRGEIAVRIIKTCQRMGIGTVAVFSDADSDALHTRMAGQAINIGPSDPSVSYLDYKKIIDAALRSKAQAIHPGYGFLSENLMFAQACHENDIKFIGPELKTIELMSDKVKARRIAKDIGIPQIPGTETDGSDEDALEAAKRIGYPVMVKATEGGGGIGIRIVRSPEKLLSTMHRARMLAQMAFGSSRLYMERYIPSAAHVEVQVLGDELGNIAILGERDCSIQRRNQKVIEETPSSRIDYSLREDMFKAAFELARHIRYSGVGTVEFLVDKNGYFYFLEINTRLQVEHGVTEMVTGIDLVEQQIRVAAGESLQQNMIDSQTTGHSIEARIYAEDVDTGMPVTGKIQSFKLPKGTNVRVDTALSRDYQITTHYDPLVAKLMVWRETRLECIAKMREALLEFEVLGIKTNIATILRALNVRSFINGTYTTGLLPWITSHKASKDQDIVTAIAIAVTHFSSHYEGSLILTQAPCWNNQQWKNYITNVPERGSRWRDV